MKPMYACLAFFAGMFVALMCMRGWRAIGEMLGLVGSVGLAGLVGPTARVYGIVSAVEDEEGWVLMDVNGDVKPWPADWPEEVDCAFFQRRGWKRVNVGTEALPKEGWMAP